ncbi:Aspartate transcarbamylase [Azospirillaceae bacterium]
MPPSSAFQHRHLLAIQGLSPAEITAVLDLADGYVDQNRRPDGRKSALLSGRTLVNLFFENSTRTRTSFELAINMGADVINMAVANSSIQKGET